MELNKKVKLPPCYKELKSNQLAQDALMEHEIFANNFHYVRTQVVDEFETSKK